MAQIKLKKIKVSAGVEGERDFPTSFPPSFHVDSNQMPEVEDWEVGKKYRLIIEVEQKSKHQNDSDVITGDFDIVAYKNISKKTLKDVSEMTDKEFEEFEGEELSKA